MAAGLLLKGPIAVVLPAGVGAVFLAIERWKLDSQGTPSPGHIALGCAARAGARAALVLVGRRPDRRGVVSQTFSGATTSSVRLGSGSLRSHPWWFYGPRLLIDLLPWSLLLPVAGIYAWRQRADREARFGSVWLAVIVVILSGARFKRADYLLPAYPGAALLLGCTLERWLQRGSQPRRAFQGATLAVLLAVYAGGWWMYEDRILAADEPHAQYRSFAAEIRRGRLAAEDRGFLPRRGPCTSLSSGGTGQHRARMGEYLRLAGQARVAFDCHVGRVRGRVLAPPGRTGRGHWKQRGVRRAAPRTAARAAANRPSRFAQLLHALPFATMLASIMYDHLPRPPIDTADLSLILTVPGIPAEAAGTARMDRLPQRLGAGVRAAINQRIRSAGRGTGRPLRPRAGAAAAGACRLRGRAGSRHSAGATPAAAVYARCDCAYRPADVKQLLQVIDKVDLALGHASTLPTFATAACGSGCTGSSSAACSAFGCTTWAACSCWPAERHSPASRSNRAGFFAHVRSVGQGELPRLLF